MQSSQSIAFDNPNTLGTKSPVINLIPKKQEDIYPQFKLTRVLKPKYNVKIGAVTPKHVKKNLTDYPSCVLGISLGNAKMEDDQLEASIRWISENFTHCSLAVGDSIYRYTLQATQTIEEQESKNKALQIGRDFVAKYEPMINRYRDTCNFEWACMSKVQQHVNFDKHHLVYKQLYVDNSVFKNLVDDSSNSYLSGAQDISALSESEKEEKLKITTNYFIEESAIFTCLCEEDRNLLIYPGTIKPLEIIAGGEIDGIPKSIQKLIQIRINLKKKGSYVVRNANDRIPTPIPPAHDLKLLTKIKNDNWDLFLSYTNKRRYKSGDIIVFNGMSNKDLYVLTKGNVEVLTGDMESGRLMQREKRGDISFINEQNFLNGSPRNTTVAALTDCEVLFLSGKSFIKMLRINPEIAAPLLLDIANVLDKKILDEGKMLHSMNKNGHS